MTAIALLLGRLLFIALVATLVTWLAGEINRRELNREPNERENRFAYEAHRARGVVLQPYMADIDYTQPMSN